MKRIFFIIFLFTVLSNQIEAQKKLHVLFIGNSYTAANNLPNMIKQIALSKGDSLFTDENTPGGYTFQAHSTNAVTLSKIQLKPWDYVVLQEQSQRPAFSPAQVAVEVYPYADSLNKYIKQNHNCTQTLFYMTWGRKNGDASNCAAYPPICTYEGMQARLRQSYLEMAQNLNASVAPVGVAWKKVRNEGDSIQLYSPDESHPSIAGTYLAACTFYATLFHKSPNGGYVPAGLNIATAQHLQQYATQVVFDSLSLWGIDTSTVKAQFNFTQAANTIYLTNMSINANLLHWNFGDGNTLIGNCNSYTYNSVGTYTITLTASNGCKIDSVKKPVQITSVGIGEYEDDAPLIFPNPTKGLLYFTEGNFLSQATFNLYNSTGQLLINNSKPINQYIDMTNLPDGIYLLDYYYNGNKKISKIIIKKNK